MAIAPEPAPLAPEVRSLLGRLRWRIRAYVWLEGLALAAVWVCSLFWAIFALDYLPIMVGASEMPQVARGFLLLFTIAGLIYITYHWILSRVFARMADRSMAVLLERRFRNFRDSLVTSVELTEQPDHAVGFNAAMLTHTNQEALQSIRDVQLDQVFNFFPLVSKLVAAGALLVSFLLFGVINPAAFEQAARRVWLLDSQPWPRSAHIEIAGIEVQRSPMASGQVIATPPLKFENGRVKVAKGSNVILKVRANAAAKTVPEYCTIYYRSDEGERGRVQMKKIGRVKNEEIDGETRSVQNYSFDAKPLKGILSTLRLDVVGYDHRLSDYRIEVVESPAVIDTTLACVFPDYMVDEETSSWQPRTVNYLATGTQLPRGTKLTLHAKANKDLRRVIIFNPETNETTNLSLEGTGEAARKFQLPEITLGGNLTLEITLQDADNVLSDRPQRIFITAIPDDAPRVDVKLKGIGTAVTANVVIPIRGKITDDYGLEKTWFDVLINDGQPREEPFPVGKGGAVEAEIDFRETRAQPDGLKLTPKDKLILKILAADKCTLQNGPNIGSGDVYHLDVVTPEELLAQLEAREISLRRRFEQIITEVTEMRDSLLRVKIKETGDDASGTDPADKKSEKSEKADKEASPAAGQEPGEEKPSEDRTRSLRLLRVQRSAQQSQKSGQEVLGVSLGFAEIREELVNNRVDTEDRKQRLQEQIANPLRQIALKSFPDLDQRLADLEKKLEDPTEGPLLIGRALEKTNNVLRELNDVLQQMLDLETYNELLDIVRDLLKEQQELIDKTKQQKKKQLLDLTK